MANEPLLSVRAVSKRFARRMALRDVSFTLETGGALGLVGPSGAGKSTLARCIALFEPPTSGQILLEGRDLWAASRAERRALRAGIQLIFQQPGASLNPRMTAGEAVAEPLLIQGRPTGRVPELLEMVGLSRHAAAARTHELSGGERQRLAIARALALAPRLLILDEPFSGLDLTVQAQVARLLVDLRGRHNLTCILISHDWGMVAWLAGEIAVMDGGAVVESGDAGRLLAAPRHPLTRELIEASHWLSLDRALKLQD